MNKNQRIISGHATRYHSPRIFYKLIPLQVFFCNFFCNFFGNSLRPPIFSVTLMRSSGSRVDWKIFFVIYTKLIPRKNFFCIANILVLMVQEIIRIFDLFLGGQFFVKNVTLNVTLAVNHFFSFLVFLFFCLFLPCCLAEFEGMS